jgi:hypothetical protein
MVFLQAWIAVDDVLPKMLSAYSCCLRDCARTNSHRMKFEIKLHKSRAPSSISIIVYRCSPVHRVTCYTSKFGARPHELCTSHDVSAEYLFLK